LLLLLPPLLPLLPLLLLLLLLSPLLFTCRLLVGRASH
jgi:hypothetical protein